MLNNKHRKFHRTMLAVYVTAMTSPAFAAEPVPDAVEEIVVKGVRANLQDAQEVKRNADTVVDSISSKDIGSLPDRSVLEAMQRIPGISIERFAGANDPDHFGVEGSGAVIRGMSSTRSEFNGRDSFTANSGRGLSFQDVPPELMGGVDVYKNQTADMIEGGIGGTVSLRTRKPFDNEERQLAFNVDYSYGDMAEEWTPTFSGLYSDQWTTDDVGRFGVLVNVSQSSLKGQSNGMQSDAYVRYLDDYTNFPSVLTGGVASAAGPKDIKGAESFKGAGVWMPQGANFRMKDDDRDRKGYALALQWESPDESLLGTFQWMRSDAELAWNERSFKSGAAYDRRQSLPLEGTAYTFDNKGLFQSGTITQDGRFSDGGWRSRDPDNPNGLRVPHAASWADPAVPQFGDRFTTNTRYKDTQTVIDDFSTSFKWTPSEAWEHSVDLQYIKANTDDDDVEFTMMSYAIQGLDLRHGTPRLSLMEPWHGLRDKNVNLSSGLAGDGPFGVAGKGVTLNGKALPGFSNDPAGDSNWFQDPTSYNWASGLTHYERSEGDSKAARYDVKFNTEKTSGIKGVRAGLRYANREQTVRYSEYDWGALLPIWVSSAEDIGWLDSPAAKDLAGSYESVNWGDFYRGGKELNLPGKYLIHPSAAFVKSLNKTHGSLPAKTDDPFMWPEDRTSAMPGSMFRPSEVFDTEETNKAAYLRVDFGSDQTAKRFDGNIGVRYVKLNRDATGSVKYPDLAPKTLPPADAPNVRDKLATRAYLDAKMNALVDAAKAGNPNYKPPVLSATPTEEEVGAYIKYNSEFFAKEVAELTKYVDDAGNFLTQNELGFGNNAATQEVASASYDTWLPSLNLKVELTDDVIARFAAAKAVAMPDMEDVKNTTSLSALDVVKEKWVYAVINGQALSQTSGAVVTGWKGTSGNPSLKPMESTQFDASLEWYFAKAGSFTFTAFNKDLKNFFVSGAFDRSYTNPLSGVSQVAAVEGTINSGSGKIQGLEIAYQQFYDMLPAPWDGLGLQANYSYIDSESVPNAGDLTGTKDTGGNDTGARVDLTGLPLKGQSKNTYNVVAMYEKNAWSARLAYNWRSRYLLTTRDVISKYPLWNDEAGFLDASLFYKLNDQFTFGVQGTNLVNTQTKTVFILDGKGLEAGRSWFVNDRRVSLILRGSF